MKVKFTQILLAAYLILVKTIKGDKITLRYSILPSERIFGILSLIASLVLVILLISLFESTNNKNFINKPLKELHI